ncbi:ShlB/FhaC/HecB family hemolysin secretion/activation protein [Bacterioplanoides sp.]|uniref:ShlB/FhaC/HecB family hemolysin secretion/activation protein n=1 Tax=Bacterioplanoides sp. TaxID=2066072 RepID=UPI003B008ACA
MKIRYELFVLCALIVSFDAYSDKTKRYFNDNESVRYQKTPYQQATDVPDEQFDNRFDREPRLVVKKFNVKNLENSLPDKNSEQELEKIIEEDLKRNKNIYTVSRFNELTRTLTNFYRSKGLLLSRVYISPQAIKNQTVVLGYAAGQIEGITVKNNRLYDEETILKPFQKLIDQPVELTSLRTATTQLGQYPGLQTKTTFSPGEQPGSTVLNITTTEEERVGAVVSFDNYGSEYTGKYRFAANGYINNITGNADQLKLGGFATISPSNSLYGNLLYRLPLTLNLPEDDSWFSFLSPVLNKGLIFESGYTQNTYTIGEELEKLDISGESSVYFIGANTNLVLNERYQATAGLFLNSKTAKTVQNGDTLSEDKLTTLVIRTDWNARDSFWAGNPATSFASFEYHQGISDFLGAMGDNEPNSRTNGKGDFAPAGFSKYVINLNRIQSLDNNQLLVDMQYIYTPDMLTPIEQTPIGGPYAVRGYQSGDYSADTALIMKAEYFGYSSSTLSLPIDHLKAGVFLDYGIGWRNEALANEESSAHLMAAGWFAEFVKDKKFNARVMMGIPLTEAEPGDDSSFQFYTTLQRKF